MLEGRYQLERRLGDGGMGIVYKARHAYLKTTHAVKVILPDLVGHDDTLSTRFRQEAMVAASIRHPNIVLVTDFGIATGELPFLVMEFIKGRSLHDVSVRHGRFSPQMALEIMSAIGSGVGAAHRQGIVHRDLKPLNVMIEDDRSIRDAVKVLDFGLAKIRSGELFGSFVQAKTTGLMGSPLYMAPEQWSDEELDSRADIYSLGIILYQMLTGDVPFKGGSLPKIMRKHLLAEPPSFAAVGLRLPNAIEACVRHALAKDPKARPKTVEDFVEEFRMAIGPDQRITSEVASQAPTQPLPDITKKQVRDTIRSDLIPELTRPSYEVFPQQKSAIQEEADRLALEFQEAQRRAEEARKRADEAARRRVEEENARRLAEEEADRKRSEEAALRRKEEEEERKRQALDAARKLIEEEEARQRAEEEERRRSQEEAARLRAKEDADRLARAAQAAQLRAEQARQQAEEEARKRSEEETARKAAEEKAERLMREVQEAQRRAEEARLCAEEEARIRAEEEAARKRLEEEEARRRAETEAQRMAAEEAARLHAKQEADRLALEVAEAQQRAEEARLRAEEESRRRAESEVARKRAEEEAQRLLLEVEEARERVQQDLRRQGDEAARKRAEDEAARKQIEAEVERRAEEAARKRAEEEAALLRTKEEEARRQIQEELERRAEEQAKKRAEEEAARKRAEEEANRLGKEIEEARRRADEARLIAEEEAQLRAQLEDQRRAEEAAARLTAKEDADRLARLFDQAKRRAEEARRNAKEESRRRSEEETARKKAEEKASQLQREVEEAQRRAETARLTVERSVRQQAEAEESRKREEESVRAIEREKFADLQEQILRLEEEKRQREQELANADVTLRTMPSAPGLTLPSEASALGSTASTNESSIPRDKQGPYPFAGDSVRLAFLRSQNSLQQSIGVAAGVEPQPRRRSYWILPLAAVVVLILGVTGYGIYYLVQSRTNKRPPTQKPRTGADMISIPGGVFMMGRNDVSQDDAQWPAHQVSVRPFFMDRTEVTNAEYAEFVRQSSYQPPWSGKGPPSGREQWPVTNVSLDDAKSFAVWRSTRDGLKYRLPTEDEWEYAARSGDHDYLYPWGNTWDADRANLGTGAGEKVDFPNPVGSYPLGANVWGVQDLIGNVWEWTSSEASFYPGHTGSVQASRGQFVMRGGSHQSLDRDAVKFRGSKEFPATFRQWVQKDTKGSTLGFRLVRDAS